MKHIYDNHNGNQKSSEERFTERFKEIASHYEPAFEHADWTAMQSKLALHNEKNRRKVIFRRLATFATMGAAAMVLLFGGYQFLDTSVNTNQNNLAIQENSIQNSKSIENTVTQNTSKENLVAKNEINLTDNLKNTTQNFTKTKSNTNSEKSNANQMASSDAVSMALSKNTQPAFNSSLNSEKEKLNNNTLARNSTIAEEETKVKNVLTGLNTKEIKLELFANVVPKEITLPKLEIDETLLASANQNEEIIRKNPVMSAVGKWRIGATLMAMTNLYKSNDKQRINYTNGYGVLADYQITRHLNLSTGAVYTQKRIDIEEPFFVPTVNNSFNPSLNDDAWVKKNKTQINWQLLDLPINLRYNAVQTDRNKWFVSAGTSNYFFLKEHYESDYTVSYQDIYDPRLTRTQEVVSQRETQSAIQLFATINVSAGLETSLGKHLTLQVEPYWKFPVRSLGSEGVFVQTGGLLTRINFAL